jgi:hypothetical protein
MTNKRAWPTAPLVQFAAQQPHDGSDTNASCVTNKLVRQYNDLQQQLGNLLDFLKNLDDESLERTIERIVENQASPGCITATITEVNDDDLTCERSDTGATITVNKPYHFRVSTFDGQTIGDITYTKVTAQRRQASGTITFTYGEELFATENQRLFPAYTVGDELAVGLLPGDAFVDLNVDGRLWVRETDVLVSGL